MPTSSATSAGPSATAPRNRASNAGFSMIEVVLGLVILGLLASLGLPAVRGQAGDAALRATAVGIVAMMRTERNAAIRSGAASMILIDRAGGLFRSTRSPAALRLAPGMSVRTEPEGLEAFRFMPDGRALEGRLFLTSGTRQVRIDVNGQTTVVTAEPVSHVTF